METGNYNIFIDETTKRSPYQVKIDSTLTQVGQAADAAAVGQALEDVGSGLVLDESSINQNSFNKIQINGFNSAISGDVPSKGLNGKIVWTQDYEKTQNKVTEWSTTTSDSNYPSEKLVKTSLEAEKSERQSQDIELAASIAAEESARIEADNSKVNKTQTIAGIDLQDNITKAEMLTALNVEDGSQVNKIEKIKVNSVEQTIADKTVDITISDQLDTNVKLSNDLYTYYNIGKVQDASGTHPVLLGSKNASLREVLDFITQMEEVQPTITAQPSISTLALSSSVSDELGTIISDINYSLTTNAGSYEFGPATGVTFKDEYIFTGGTSSIETSTSGTLTLTTPYIVGTSGVVNFNCVGTHSQGVVAKTNLGKESNPEIRITEGSKSATGTFTKSAVAYPYYTTSASEAAPTTGTKCIKGVEDGSGATLNYVKDQYFWIFSTNNTTEKQILIYSDIAKSWSPLLGGTQAPIEITFTMKNEKTRTYYAYRTTNVAQSSGSALIKFAVPQEV